ncbi:MULTISPECIES: TfoX/Sxy family protein [unclassified Bradyrhizobium]|uniref:TfoX/Sxy family protein n=1 Tax=unclassified Bradyrhizobium TaxID=2631580 RepID=UPI0020113EC0|nr:MULTISPECIES: TfoX/Sxy family protein [unclassified Bradyrhizobium]
MFGKTGLFCDGVMLGMVTDNTFYVRVDEQNRETSKEAATSPPLNYAKQGATIDLAFWRVPERLLMNPTNSSSGRRLRWQPRAGSQPNERGPPRPRENRERVRRSAAIPRDARLTRTGIARTRGSG